MLGEEYVLLNRKVHLHAPNGDLCEAKGLELPCGRQVLCEQKCLNVHKIPKVKILAWNCNPSLLPP